MSRRRALLTNVLAVAVCALVYELLCGTLASYLLGDAVLQFSLVLGTYLFAMGVGAWISKRLEPAAATRYVQVELLLAVVGGLSVPLLMLAVSWHVPLRPLLHAVVFAVGTLVGIELPLLITILKHNKSLGKSDSSGPTEARSGGFADTVSKAFAFDYIGALFASVLFPLVLVPYLGLVKTSVVTGLVNAAIALSATWLLETRRPLLTRLASVSALALLGFALVRAETWTTFATDWS